MKKRLLWRAVKEELSKSSGPRKRLAPLPVWSRRGANEVASRVYCKREADVKQLSKMWQAAVL
jgi:hypothetical protein